MNAKTSVPLPQFREPAWVNCLATTNTEKRSVGTVEKRAYVDAELAAIQLTLRQIARQMLDA